MIQLPLEPPQSSIPAGLEPILPSCAAIRPSPEVHKPDFQLGEGFGNSDPGDSVMAGAFEKPRSCDGGNRNHNAFGAFVQTRDCVEECLEEIARTARARTRSFVANDLHVECHVVTLSDDIDASLAVLFLRT